MSDSRLSGSNTEQTSTSTGGSLGQSNEATLARGNATTNIINSNVTLIAGNSNSVVVRTKQAEFDDNIDVASRSLNVEESLARNFQIHVNKRSLQQSIGGVTDSFKNQNLHEPSSERNPRMKKLTQFYGNELALEKGDYKMDPLFHVSAKEPDDNKMISPQDLVKAISDEKQRVIAVVGQAGSGKTTLIKRLVRDIIESNNSTKSQTHGEIFAKHFKDQEHKFEFVHFLNVKDLDMADNRVTAKKLLFSNHFEELDQKEIQCGYEWLKKNSKKVLFVFDGLDQAKWTMPTEFKKISHTDEADVEVVLANILCGHLFKNAQILLSSREHSIALLTTKLRPNVVVAMMGLPLKDIEMVFNELVKSKDDDGNENFKTLPPAIIPLCSIPLFLIYCAIIYQKCSAFQSSTMTAVLFKILQIFIRSDHVFKKDLFCTIAIFKKMSFDGHFQKRVTFTLPELERYGLNREEIRGGFIINVPDSPVLDQNLFDGDYRIFFSHQTLQEILAAMYVCEKKVDDFRSFAHNELVEPHWSVVRRFVCGLLSNPECQDSNVFGINQKSEKWMILKETLQNTADLDSSKRLELLALLYESQDIDLIQSLVTEIVFHEESLTPAGIHAISSVIRCCQYLAVLMLGECCINRELAEVLERTTRNSKLKVRRLDVSFNHELGENKGFFCIGSTTANLKAEEVVIKFCGLGKNGLEDFIKGTCHAKIRRLNVSGNKELKQNNGFVSLGSAVAHFEAEEVVMRICEIEGIDLKNFVRGAGDSKIRLIDLSGNDVMKRTRNCWELFGSPKFMGENGLSNIINIVHRNKVEILVMKSCNFETEQLEKFKKSIPGVDFRY